MTVEGWCLIMKRTELERRFDSLYVELTQKGINCCNKKGQTKNINFIAKGQMYQGLYDRTQSDIISELSQRKNSIELETGRISDYFDRIHHAYTIMVFQTVLLKIDHNTDLKGKLIGKSPYYWTELARDEGKHLRENFQKITGKTLYQDFLILLDGSQNERNKRQNYMPKVEELIVKSYHNIFDNTRFEENNPFGFEKKSVENVVINEPYIPKKSVINKEKNKSLETQETPLTLFDNIPDLFSNKSR